MAKLLQTATKDGLYLHGLINEGDVKKPAVLYIHGFCGNFYENFFVHHILNKLEKENITFLTANTRGNGKNTDFNTTTGKFPRIGGLYEKLDESHLDISAWIEELLKRGHQKIILAGHSLGTIKTVRYLFEGKHADKISRLILVCPFDNIYLAKKESNGQWENHLIDAKNMIASGDGEELVPQKWSESKTSAQTYVSWLGDKDYSRTFDFHNPKYDFPILNKITIPVRVIVGSKDEYFYTKDPDHPEEAFGIMKKNIKDFDGTIIPEANHGFQGFEDQMSQEFLDYVK